MFSQRLETITRNRELAIVANAVAAEQAIRGRSFVVGAAAMTGESAPESPDTM